jgi:hypothetical protein
MCKIRYGRLYGDHGKEKAKEPARRRTNPRVGVQQMWNDKVPCHSILMACIVGASSCALAVKLR